jgi:PQQ-dependent catabolism-associated CXXCW motif protein
MRPHLLLLAAALIAGAASLGPAWAEPPEPEGLWTGPMAGETPATLAGAQLVDVAGLEALIRRGSVVLVDSGPADRKPDGLPEGALWKPIHRSIPGAMWFPGAGRGDLPVERVEALLRRIDELTKGDKSVPVVSFCQPNCWGSWNLGKRLVQAGYTAVYWFPGGVRGWQETGETAAVQPEAGWETRP